MDIIFVLPEKKFSYLGIFFAEISHTNEKRSVKTMNANAELLNYVYQNSQMGIDTLTQILELLDADEEEFRAVLKKQLNGYREFHAEASQKLRETCADEKGLSMFEKISAYFMLNIQTMLDKSPSHIAEMMIQGSTMGITDIEKQLHKYGKVAEQEYLRFAKRLEKFEEGNIKKLKKYL